MSLRTTPLETQDIHGPPHDRVVHPSVQQNRRASQRYETIKRSTPGLRKPAGWGKRKLLTPRLIKDKQSNNEVTTSPQLKYFGFKIFNRQTKFIIHLFCTQLNIGYTRTPRVQRGTAVTSPSKSKSEIKQRRSSFNSNPHQTNQRR